MNQLLFIVLLTFCGATILWAVRRPGGLYQYPALVAVTIVGWVTPQLMILVDYHELPAGTLPLALTMILLSFAAVLLGWWRGAAATPRSQPAHLFDETRLMVGAVLLSLFGAFFRLVIRTVPAELLEMSAWSGPQTIYVFFAQTQILAMGLGWLVFLRSGRLAGLCVALFNLLFLLDAIFIGGRRSVIVEVGVIALVGIWLVKRWAPPRTLLIVGALALTVLFSVIGEYRNATSARMVHTDRIGLAEAWNNIKQIDFLESLKREVGERDPRLMELYNATLVIGATQERLDFTGLANYWDQLVFSYVPGQLVGFDLKASLMFATEDPMLLVYGQEALMGTTRTGFADAFRAFWFFGALVFFGFAWLMGHCWRRAMRGQILFQFLYLVLMRDALLAVTHSTAWFVAFWPFVAIFAAPVFLFAYRGRMPITDDASTTSAAAHPPSGKAPLFTPPKSFPIAR